MAVDLTPTHAVTFLLDEEGCVHVKCTVPPKEDRADEGLTFLDLLCLGIQVRCTSQPFIEMMIHAAVEFVQAETKKEQQDAHYQA